MLKKVSLWILALLLFGCSSIGKKAEPDEEKTEFKTVSDVKYSGLRSSSYGINPFPHPKGWEHAFNKMEDYFPGSQACGIWIISNININNSDCILEFPRNEGDTKEYENVIFSPLDKHEKYLKYFDENNIKVFLQVESGQADMFELIDIILTRYGHHPSVIGFGVDLEWYDPYGRIGMNGDTYHDALSTKMAEEWDKKIKSYNPDYRLFLKHWLHSANIMPQNTKSDIIYINDAQDFSNFTDGDANRAIDAMVDYFDEWAKHFRRDGYIRSVGYQIGYDSDRNFWQALMEYPYPKSYAERILERIPPEQEVSIFWVDFSMDDVFLGDYTGPLPVTPVELPALGENYAEDALVTVSSVEDDHYGGSKLVDNNLDTRWASLANDKEWVNIKLSESRDIKTVVLFWEAAFASSYTIEASTDGINWEEIYTTSSSKGGIEFVNVDTNGEYIKINTLKRGTEWGNSLYEVAIFGESS